MPEMDIRERLFAMSDAGYREMQIKIIPTISPERVIGVRTPALRAMAKELIKTGEADAFIRELPHRYFDEDQLHAFIISEIKDLNRCLEEVDGFLPYIDNWATCDQLSPKVFGKNKKELLPYTGKWTSSKEVYTVRFGIGMLMAHFLDEDFDIKYAEAVATVKSGEYYVKMMIAWYFATALAKQYDAVVPFIEEQRLDAWTHNKAIQKATESRRISDERKEYLKGLKVKA